MLIDLAFLGLEMHISTDDAYHFVRQATLVDSRFNILFVSSDNTAQVMYEAPVPFGATCITPHGAYSNAASAQLEDYTVFKQKIILLNKMITENLSEQDILEMYPELVI